MTETESKIVAAWKEAAADLGFQFTSPFVVTLPDGSQNAYLGFVHQFGHRKGAIIAVHGEPSQRIPRPERGEYFYSILYPIYGKYDRRLFINTLDDWKFFGSENDTPKWYSGES